MKEIRFVLLAFLTIYNISVFAQDNVIDEIVWVVGDEPIFRSDVEAKRLQAQYDGVKFSGDPYCVIPEQLAVQKLFLHQADLDSVIVTDNDVMADVDRNINRYMASMGSKEKMEEVVRMPINKFREVQRELAKNQETEKRVKASIIGSTPITPAEVRQYFNSLPSDSVPVTPAEVEVEIITIEPKFSAAETEEIKERLRGFTERVNKGDKFSTLAVMYSDDRNSAKVGGELGFFGKGDLYPEFANVAFSLSDPKKVSKIVETEAGFHIIQLIEKRGDRINVRHILLKPTVSATEKNQAILRLDSIADLIRDQKLKFEDAAILFSFDKDTRNNGGLMVRVNPNTGTSTSHFQLEELPQGVGDMVYKMNVGEISKPFSMINDKGKEFCAIVRVKSKSKAHKASLTEDFQQLKQMVQAKKSQNILNEWILEKQKKTYVRISEKWRNCEFQYPGWIKK